MCGIVWVKRGLGFPANKSVIKRFQSQKHRGVLGFGYIAVKNGYVVAVEKSTSEKEILEKLHKEDAEEILFHHRQPTGGQENFVQLAHPMVIEDDNLQYNYLTIHNGVISNAEVLKRKHEGLGFIYQTHHEIVTSTITETFFGEKLVAVESPSRVVKDKFNDSESLAFEVALLVEGFGDKLESHGGTAFISYQVEKETNKVIGMFYGSNEGRPLIFETQKKKGKKREEVNPSDVVSIKSEGKGVDLLTDTLYFADYLVKGRPVTKTLCKIGGYTPVNRVSSRDDKWDWARHKSLESKSPTVPKYLPTYRNTDDNGYTNKDLTVGFHRDKDDLVEKSKNVYSLDLLTGEEYDSNEEDQKITDYINDSLATQIIEEDKKGLLRKQETVLEELIDLDAEYKQCLDSIFDGGGYNMTRSAELDMLKEEIAVKTREYTEINERLEEIGEQPRDLYIPTS